MPEINSKFKSEIGNKYNNLTIIDFVYNEQGKAFDTKCLCDCGKEHIVNSICKIISGHTKSCGCLIYNVNVRYQHLIGQKYEKLTIIKFIFNKKTKRTGVLCRCDCGKERLFTKGMHSLTSGNFHSCGCTNKENRQKATVTHGKWGSKTYQSWANMLERCTNPNNSAWKNYGGRGIKVCERWLNSFENFYKDMGYRPSGKTLDRVNNNDNYYKENCRWATCKEQGNNRRNNIILEFNGKSQTLSQWVNEIGINYNTLSYRISHGWPTEKAFTTPSRQNKL